MPAVVRGGRRQDSAQAKKSGRSGASNSGARGPDNRARTGHGAPNQGGFVSGARAFGGVPMPSELTAWVAVGGFAVLLGAFVLTGGRGEAIGQAVVAGMDRQLAGLGFKLENARLVGVSSEAAKDVRAALALHKDQPLALMDLKALKERVETVGWVAEARVIRQLPDTLVIEVTERERLAVWQSRGVTQVIDSKGQPIPEADARQFVRLPLIVGEGANEVAHEILPLLRARPRLYARLEALVRVDQRRWDIRLKDGSLIHLPALDEDSALLQLDTIDQTQRLLELGFASIDLRNPEAIYVQPKPRSLDTILAARPPGAPA